jgi:outer membrane murein-binding lipoprotein Lpp
VNDYYFSATAPDGNTTLLVIGSIVAALLAFAGVIYGQRAAAKANARTAAVQERTADTAGMSALVAALQAETARLSAEVSRLVGRVETLESDRDAARTATAVAVAEARAERTARLEAIGWGRALRELLARLLPGTPIPPAPASVEPHL